MSDLAAVAAQALDLARARPATLGSGRLICIDGPSGSGKSTLARELARLAAATVVSTDDVCPGWDGLPRMAPLLEDLLGALAEGRPGSCPRYDWLLARTAGSIDVAPAALVVLEGVGAGARAWAGLTTVLIWTDAPTEVRRERALARDGDHFRPYWDQWARAESAYFGSEDPERRADLRIGTGS